MSTPEFGDKVRVLDSKFGDTEAEYTVVRDKWGYEGFFGEPEFTAQDENDRIANNAHYFEVDAEDVVWERVDD